MVEASVSGYCEHLREMAADRGGEAGVSARERSVALTQELRGALEELANA